MPLSILEQTALASLDEQGLIMEVDRSGREALGLVATWQAGRRSP